MNFKHRAKIVENVLRLCRQLDDNTFSVVFPLHMTFWTTSDSLQSEYKSEMLYETTGLPKTSFAKYVFLVYFVHNTMHTTVLFRQVILGIKHCVYVINRKFYSNVVSHPID